MAEALSNEQMKPYRFERWAKYRAMYRKITEALRSGRRVTIATYTKATVYDIRHLDMFSVGKTGCWVQRGKRRDDISLCAIIVS